MRTARSLTSKGNRFSLFIALSSQRKEPLGKSGRFTNYSKAKLGDLESLRDMQTTLEISQYEFIAWRPSEDIPEYTNKQIQNLNDGIEELNGEAASRPLGTLFVNAAREASQRIIEHEIA